VAGVPFGRQHYRDLAKHFIRSGLEPWAPHKAKVSTKHPDSMANHVICVYTTKALMDEVGLQLIQIVKQNLHYKTDAATGQVHTQQFEGKNFRRDLYWNKARFHQAIYYDCRKSRSSAGKAAEEKPKPALSLR
jgi:hypothetical protein